jgi:hypothetical protein
MFVSWIGTLIGAVPSFITGIGASLVVVILWDLRTRYRAYKTADHLVGKWESYEIHGGMIDSTPMEGASLTEVSHSRRRCAMDSGLLHAEGEDTNRDTGQKRKHSSSIVMDPGTPWLAWRILRYANSDEISQQRLEIDPDNRDTVFLFPDPTLATGGGFSKHAWQRKR